MDRVAIIALVEDLATGVKPGDARPVTTAQLELVERRPLAEPSGDHLAELLNAIDWKVP